MPTRKNRQRTQLLITAGVVGLLALGVGVALLRSPLETPDAPAADAPAADAQQADAPPTPPPTESAATADESALVDDDGRTLWASPTDGAPLQLDYLPPGCQLILSLQPAAMSRSPDGRIVLDQFATVLRSVVGDVARVAPTGLTQIERLTIAVRPTETFGQLERTFVIQTGDDDSSSDAQTERAARGANGMIQRFADGTMVIAPPAALDEIRAAEGQPPPLRRELELLADASDRDRHATLLLAPNFLFAEGQTLFRGGVAAFRSPLFEELPDELRGLMVSVHWQDDSFYWEARANAASDLPQAELMRLLDARVRGWPNALQLAVLDLNPAPHGRRVVANLPAMTRLAANYTRRGVRDKQAVLNGYLPPGAGHNLLIAAELMLAQLSAGGGGGGGATLAANPIALGPKTFAERLQQPVTVVFDRDTLEMALRILSAELQTPIVIRGRDLQLEGITKNQSFGLDQRNRPGEAVLVEILALANPDRTATGPTDPRQKLVYVVGIGDDGTQTVFVTTRAAAASRGEPLPSVFKQ